MKNQVLELKGKGVSVRSIADQLGISKGSVQNYLKLVDDISLDSEKTTADAVEVVNLAPVDRSSVKEAKLLVNNGSTLKEAVLVSLIGFDRMDVNEYVNKGNGEIIRIKFVRSLLTSGYGHFISI